MRNQNLSPNPMEPLANFFAQIPQILEVFQEIKENQQKILERLENSSEGEFEGFLTEERAKRILGKEKSWLHKKRCSGELRFTKIGGAVWYHKDDILQLFYSTMNK